MRTQIPLSSHNFMSFNSNEKPILIVVHSNTFFVELFRLAKCLQSSGKYDPVVMFAYQYPTHREDAERCAQVQIQCLDVNGVQLTEDGPSVSSAVMDLPLQKSIILFAVMFEHVRIVVRKILVFLQKLSLINLIYEYKSFRNRFSSVKSVINKQKPCLLVLGGDMVGYDTSVYIDVAHQKNIPVIILPSTMSNGLEQAEVYFHDPNYNFDRWVNRIAANLYPKWVRIHRGRRLLRVPGERVLVMEYLGLGPPLPWIFNSGFADAIVVESKQMKRYYLECGIPEGQLKLIGSLADDVMTDILRRKEQMSADLCLELGLKADKRILLTALPPDFLYVKGGRPESDFKTYRELVEFWVRSIAKTEDFNIIVCLHPSVRPEDFQYIEEWGVKIAKRGTAELVPLCDLYVASVSSTIRWAIACGIPVINYDVYRYRYTDYLDVKGVVAVDSKTDFQFVLNQMTNDDSFYAQQRLLQQRSADEWGIFDGKVGERLEGLLASMIESYALGEQIT